MTYLLLFVAIACNASQSIISKEYNRKVKSPNPFVYSAIVALCALLFFLAASLGRLSFTASLLPYAALFGLCYGTATMGLVMATRLGPLSITSLVIQCSLILPTLFGIFYLKEPLRPFGYIGIVLLFLSLFLVSPTSSLDERRAISGGWFLFLSLGFLGNGGCTIIQKMQQLAFSGDYKNEFMILALSLVVLLLAAVAVIGGGKTIGKDALAALGYAPLKGFANGLLNLLVMVLSAILPVALLFPSLTAGCMIITFVVSLAVYKEKLSPRQVIGYLFGMVSIVLLSLG